VDHHNRQARPSRQDLLLRPARRLLRQHAHHLHELRLRRGPHRSQRRAHIRQPNRPLPAHLRQPGGRPLPQPVLRPDQKAGQLTASLASVVHVHRGNHDQRPCTNQVQDRRVQAWQARTTSLLCLRPDDHGHGHMDLGLSALGSAELAVAVPGPFAGRVYFHADVLSERGGGGRSRAVR